MHRDVLGLAQGPAVPIEQRVEQSRRVEKLARTRASPISSTIEDNALPITSTVIGSIWLVRTALTAAPAAD
jgi:hypothetical protein